MDNFRQFEAGPDPFGQLWKITFRWLQTGISIRHSDTVDVKFQLENSGRAEEKIVALPHEALLRLSRKLGRALTDPWCSRLAALHIRYMVDSDQDMEKTLVVPSEEQLEQYASSLQPGTVAARN